jgi:cell division protein FtsW (lipid II flippase)
MAVTRSTPVERRQQSASFAPKSAKRPFELMALIGASLLIVVALCLVYQAKLYRLQAQVGQTKLLNLNELQSREQLLPLLDFVSNARERLVVATRIFEFVQTEGPLANVGAVGRLRTSNDKALLNSRQVAELKRSVSVRTEAQFRTRVLLWGAVFFFAFYASHFFLSWRGFRGPQGVLPALHLLTGVGFCLMLSLRDPLRDTLAFAEFAQSVALGCALLSAAVLIDFPRLSGKLSYIPLLSAIALSSLLILFGTGPGSSDAKVNLFGFQPVEAIKLLIVFFLSGYFTRRWEFLRVLKESRPELAGVSKHLDVPRLEYLLPLVATVALTLIFFFLQKDLGPAMIILCVFLAVYAVARARWLFAFGGLLLLILGFAAGFFINYPRTVGSRISMWLSPWDNTVRGGEQVVHALWAFATGGIFGTGLGLGDAQTMPAAHTDLILAALGEEWGFAGIVAVYALYVVLAYLGFRIALRATTDYAFFLALGLTLMICINILLISFGVLALMPLSGVVTPFLSYGGTAMLANFLVFGILLSLSRDGQESEQTAPFRLPVHRLTQVLAAGLLVVLGKAAFVQVINAGATVGAGTLTVQADGFRRYQYNPRLTAIAAGIPRGTIFDRNDVPLATSDWKLLESKQLTAGSDPLDNRHYPFGAITAHLLGDLRSRANWGARNSSLAERDAMVRLQGYNDRATVVKVPGMDGKPTYVVRHDYRELIPLLRHRYDPTHPDVLKVMNRERDLHMSIDIRLQQRAARILQAHLKKLNRNKGALVVMEAETGDLLASVSYPWPQTMPPQLGPDDGTDEMLDRARYGLYPPGSTFKIVTAIAALRKDPAASELTYECRALPDGRVGNFVRGWGRPIRDDVADRAAHGAVNMQRGTAVSCNAYFAQLGTFKVGSQALFETASLLGIATASPNTAAKLKDALPQAAYGQAQVVASPFQLARVAAAIAASGKAPYGRWFTDEANDRIDAPKTLLAPQLADRIGSYMRQVVTDGTGRSVSGSPIPIAGKTGTAEVEKKPSHAWFIGYAPYGGPRKLAFAVLVENGQYGGSAAAPIAGDLVQAASELGLFQ